MKKILLIPLALLLAVSAAISNADTKLQVPWMDRNYVYNNDPFKSILVIGVPDRPEYRRQLEDSLVKALEKNGAHATASLDIMSAETEVNRDSVVAALAGKDVDGVFLTSLFRTDDTEFVEGGEVPTTWRSERDFKLLLWQDYQGAYDQSLSAPKTEKHRLVLENQLYHLKTEELIWSVQSYSMNPKSADKVIKSLSKEIGEQLRRDGLI